MRLGETLAADIILSVTDKHGNKTERTAISLHFKNEAFTVSGRLQEACGDFRYAWMF